MTQQEKIAHLRRHASVNIPDNLSVGGYLYLQGTAITALPDNLSVGGSLDLRGTAITALPDNLSVGGYLDLTGLKIEGAQYDCGRSKRTVAAYRNDEGKIVVSLGCFIGDFEEAKEAITNKYGDGKEANEYIKKVKLAFDYLAKKTK